MTSRSVSVAVSVNSTPKQKKTALKQINRHWQLYFVLLLPVFFLILFNYIPMLGVQIAFKNYNVVDGIWGSPWVGLDNFTQFMISPNFWPLLRNTLSISIYALIAGFPAPILLALALNELRDGFFKRFVQTVTYAPYFISTVVMVSIVIVFLNPTVGAAGMIMRALGLHPVDLLSSPHVFSSVYVWSSIWQETGYGAIIYLAALSGINPELYEAARVDGASRLQKILHVDLPGILPAAVILLILAAGHLMNIGFEKIYLFQNPLNLSVSEVISTYVYKIGLLNANFSFSSAVGLFNSIANLILILIVNFIARRMSEHSLW